MSRPIRALIVDDERLARQKVRTLLSSDDDVEIIGECSNASEAVANVKREKPDLLLLDVEMPGANGFDVLHRLRGEKMPAVIFITAHDEYAVRAFDVQAIDYVMKPFDRRRFTDALKRAKRRLADVDDDAEARILRLLEHMVKPKRVEHFVVKVKDRTFLVPIIDVDWIEAEGKYVRLHAAGTAHLVRESITEVEERLDTRRFLRIHRATIVNLKRIAEMQKGFGGSLFVVLRDGTKLTMSRRYRTRIREATGVEG